MFASARTHDLTYTVRSTHREGRAGGWNGVRGSRVRVLAAGCQPLYLEELTQTIRSWPEFALIGSTATSEFPVELRRSNPDVAIVDAGDLTASLVDSIEETAAPRLLVLLGADPDPGVVYRASARGVGLLSKSCSDDRAICDAIAASARGEQVIAAALQATLVGELRLRARNDRPLLTEREHQILAFLGEDLTTPQIARRLDLSRWTVKTHVQRIYGKLDVHGGCGAIREAMRRGLLE